MVWNDLGEVKVVLRMVEERLATLGKAVPVLSSILILLGSDR